MDEQSKLQSAWVKIDGWLQTARHGISLFAVVAIIFAGFLFLRAGCSWIKIAVRGDAYTVRPSGAAQVNYSCDADRIERLVTCCPENPAYQKCMDKFTTTCGGAR